MRLHRIGAILMLWVGTAAPGILHGAQGPQGAQSAASAVVELNETGWKVLQSGDGERASRLFAEALSLKPDDPVLLLGAGASAHVRGKPADAMARLRRALEVNPKLTPASALLGEIAYTQGEIPLAIKTYENALKHAPADAALSKRLQEWRDEAQVHRGFEERRYDRFRVMFEGRAEESVANRATQVLNAAFWRIGDKLGAFPADAVVVMLYTEKQFRDITRAPDWSGGIYDGRIRIPAAGASHRPELFERVLVHELTHAMVTSIAPSGVPAWLHEGLAQHFEGEDVDAARRRVRTARGRIPLSRLEEGFAGLSAADAQMAYDESLLAVQVLLQRPAFGWTRLLHALAASNRVEYTLNSFGLFYADLEAAF